MSRPKKHVRHNVSNPSWIGRCRELVDKRALVIVPGAVSLALIGGAIYNSPVYTRLFPQTGNVDSGDVTGLAPSTQASSHSQLAEVVVDDSNETSLQVTKPDKTQPSRHQDAQEHYQPPERQSQSALLGINQTCSQSGEDTSTTDRIQAEFRRHEDKLNSLASLKWLGRLFGSDYQTEVNEENQLHKQTLEMLQKISDKADNEC